MNNENGEFFINLALADLAKTQYTNSFIPVHKKTRGANAMGEEGRRVSLYRNTYQNGDSGSALAYFDSENILKIEIYETGDGVELHHGDWDIETFITVKGDYPTDILELLEKAGEGWEGVLNKHNLKFTKKVW